MSKPVNTDDFPPLSDNDVNLLYDIIATAEASDESTYRALFAAYDKILAEHNIKADHDQVYFRFLLRMREGRKGGEGLFDQFRALLDQLGIQVDFDDTPSAEGDQKQPADASRGRGDLNGTKGVKSTSANVKPPRRVSFDSVPHILNHSQHVDHTSSVRSRSQDSAQWSRQRAAPKSLPHGSGGKSVLSRRPNHPNLNTSTSGQYNSKSKRPNGVSQKETGGTVHQNYAYSSSEASDEETKTDVELVKHAAPLAHPPAQRPTSRAESIQPELFIEAQAFRIRSIIAIARSFLHRGIRAATQYHQLKTIAQNHDIHTLTRQAFDQWRTSFVEKQQIAETEKFFGLLGSRAGKARDIFLLSKAFTHWAQSASEEAMRTSAARRHILRTRYFNAWKDITVVNELKVRRQVLLKPFSVWKRRAAKTWYEAEQAKLAYHRNLISRTYCHWFWYFCEQRAPLWFKTKLSAKALRKWVDATRVKADTVFQADRLRNFRVCQKALWTWRHRLQTCQHAVEQALSFRQKELLGAKMNALQVTARLVAPFDQLVRIRDSRVARYALLGWTKRSSLALRASEIDASRIMRNTWTIWNDSVRCQVLTRSINERLMLQALYRWLIAERLALWTRLHNDKLKTGIVDLWKRRTNDLCADLGQAKYSLRDFRQRRILSSCLKTWSSQTQSETTQVLRAERFRKRKVVAASMHVWVSKKEYLTQMDGWATDASFYVACISAVKRWQEAATTAKRLRRREAYVTVRRKTKTRMVHQVLHKWHSATSTTMDLRSQAADYDQRRLIKLGTKLFGEWRSQTSMLMRADVSANNTWREHSLQYCLQTMIDRHRELARASMRADEFAVELLETSASSTLRKLNWEVFQCRQHEQTAESLNLRNRRKHYKSMINYWSEKAVAHRQPLNPSLPRSATQTDVGDDDDGFSIDLGIPPQLQLDDLDMSIVDRPGSMSATPAYLRTPSRRSVKSRTRLNLSTTPATTHLTPFMNRLLGTGSTTKRVRSARGDFARRFGESRFGGFDDIPETSPLSQD